MATWWLRWWCVDLDFDPWLGFGWLVGRYLILNFLNNKDGLLDLMIPRFPVELSRVESILRRPYSTLFSWTKWMMARTDEWTDE